ncbi:cytochrome c biogenesis protein ResB [Nocardioides campestrisoli]|uniref:cytochrome c biogenesis protein ResB n=1 Tax=Nocardioides campestrisoli TaxID=2736757 RepID=UPI0015E65A2D|nr:cytochrome c biogenesis protein ResB [Nocardioides campestrisoli]
MSASVTTPPRPSGPSPDPGRRPGELGLRELGRWTWRQLTSMRTALVLLLLLALAAVPGSVVPQENIDALAASRWKESHSTLAPIYERLGLFSVYETPWFAAIYLLLMISLVGCIIPRTLVYAKALRARPPRAPRNLTRLPDSTTYETDASPEEALAGAREVLKGRRYRVDTSPEDSEDRWVAAERGYLREAGNLLFHLSIIVVLVGFAMGSLLGYKGGVIVLVGNGFSNNLTQYDEFEPGSLFRSDWMEPFAFDVTDFDVEWLTSGPAAGQARKFVSHLSYTEEPGAEPQEYDLRVNHPLTIGKTDVFLIGHGYAPVITIRDGNGDVAWSGPSIFLPTDTSFRSFGVVKASDARPEQIGLQGELYPTFAFEGGKDGIGPYSSFGNAADPLISMTVWRGDLGMDDPGPQSVYVLDTSKAEQVTQADGSMFRLDLRPGEEAELPDGLGTVSFDGLQRWNKIQISQTPGKLVALGGVSLALVGLVGSLYIRPRRVWVRARRTGSGPEARTLVEIAGLDRAGGGDVASELAEVRTGIMGTAPAADDPGTDAGNQKEQSS